MRRLLFTALMLWSWPNAATAAVEFAGYINAKDVRRFVITDVDSGTTSGWLAIGGVFKDYKVVGFEAAEEILVVDHDGKTIRLPLKDAHVRSADKAQPEKIEIQLKVSAGGGLLVDGQPVNLEALEGVMRQLAATGAPLALYFHAPPDTSGKVLKTLDAVLRAVPKSGAKKYSLKIVDEHPATTESNPTSVAK